MYGKLPAGTEVRIDNLAKDIFDPSKPNHLRGASGATIVRYHDTYDAYFVKHGEGASYVSYRNLCPIEVPNASSKEEEDPELFTLAGFSDLYEVRARSNGYAWIFSTGNETTTGHIVLLKNLKPHVALPVQQWEFGHFYQIYNSYVIFQVTAIDSRGRALIEYSNGTIAASEPEERANAIDVTKDTE